MKLLRKWLKILSLLVSILSVPLTGLADEIKPGLVISKDNYNIYLPELKKLLFPSIWKTPHFQGIKKGWITIPVIESKKYPLTKFGKTTLANEGKFRVEENNLLVGDWKQGAPFPHPKTGVELAWSFYRHRAYRDHDRWPAQIYMFHKDGTMDRKFKWLQLKRHYTGRIYIPPIPEEPGNNGLIESKEAQVFYAPFDVKGFILLRIRYESLFKNDDVYAYIPAIRRIRRLTGSDVTDPLVGSDLCMDDFEMWRQKIDTKMTFHMSEGEFLFPRFYSGNDKPAWDPIKNKYCIQLEWSKQPFWILDVRLNDPNYVYSRRVIYILNDYTFRPAATEIYDQKGRMLKVQPGVYCSLQPETNDLENFWYYIAANAITGHHTVLDVGTYNTDVPKEIFSIKKLLRFAR